MFFIIGLGLVFESVQGRYISHGDPRILCEPLGDWIILSAGISNFIISKPKPVIIGASKHLARS